MFDSEVNSFIFSPDLSIPLPFRPFVADIFNLSVVVSFSDPDGSVFQVSPSGSPAKLFTLAGRIPRLPDQRGTSYELPNFFSPNESVPSFRFFFP